MGTALVTGATSGLGEEFCWQLAAANHDLVIVARRVDRLRELAENLHQLAGVDVEVLPADLADPEQVDRVARRLEVGLHDPSGLAPIGLLVNNAGFGQGTGFLDDDIDDELAALDVMVRAVLVLTHAVLRPMVERGRGAVLNVSSVAADTGMGTYSAHKAWVRAFTEGLSVELAGTGVTATATMPGMTRTEFHAAAGSDVREVPGFAWLGAEQVVSESLDAVRRGRVLVTPSLRYRAAMTLTRHVPRPLVRAVVSHLPHM